MLRPSPEPASSMAATDGWRWQEREEEEEEEGEEEWEAWEGRRKERTKEQGRKGVMEVKGKAERENRVLRKRKKKKGDS